VGFYFLENKNSEPNRITRGQYKKLQEDAKKFDTENKRLDEIINKSDAELKTLSRKLDKDKIEEVKERKQEAVTRKGILKPLTIYVTLDKTTVPKPFTISENDAGHLYTRYGKSIYTSYTNFSLGLLLSMVQSILYSNLNIYSIYLHHEGILV
jgi:hypothetical protein